MALYVNQNRMTLLGLAWSGTGPGLPGTQSVSGTITSPSDISNFVMGGEPGTSSNVLEASTFGGGGFVGKYPGFKSGDAIQFDAFSDVAAAALHSIVNTTLGGLNAFVYLDQKPTNSARSATNPSFVAYGFIAKYSPWGGAADSMAKASLTIEISGKFDYLTA